MAFLPIFLPHNFTRTIIWRLDFPQIPIIQSLRFKAHHIEVFQGGKKLFEKNWEKIVLFQGSLNRLISKKHYGFLFWKLRPVRKKESVKHIQILSLWRFFNFTWRLMGKKEESVNSWDSQKKQSQENIFFKWSFLGKQIGNSIKTLQKMAFKAWPS